jgi:hypothetical protein
MASVAQTQKSPQEIFTHSLDLNYIRKFIPIHDVWMALADEDPGLGMADIRGDHVSCWRRDQHQHGDRTPSLHFNKHNRFKCHVCDSRYGSTLDLIQKVRGCDFVMALRWTELHWEVPLAGPGRPAGSHAPLRPYRVGYGSILQPIILSGLYSELSVPARILLSVVADAPKDDRKEVNWSYITLATVSGLSRAAVHKAVLELKENRIISIRQFIRPGTNKLCNAYKITLDDPDLLKRIELARGAHQFANDQARALAAIARKFRSHHKKRV